MIDMIKNLVSREESGQGMVEYGLIVALVSIVVIAVLATLGENLEKLFTKAGEKVKPADAGGTPSP